MSPETSAMVLTGVIMIILAVISFKIGKKIANRKK
jgi:hypothetical protein